jgi:hypothetical protein
MRPADKTLQRAIIIASDIERPKLEATPEKSPTAPIHKTKIAKNLAILNIISA